MKNLFPGFVRKTQEEIASLWDNAIICLDTNVLLDLYRYSDETRSAVMKLFFEIKDNIYLPKHVAWEYQKNRYDVILQQHDPYHAIEKEVKSVLDKINSDTAHPFFSKKLLNLATNFSNLITEESEKARATFDAQLNNDTIFEQLCELFEGKVGGELDSKLDIEKLGNERYKGKIPPGYMDIKKEENRFGDLIIWLQIIEIANDKKKPILLVTNDVKEDWLWVGKGERKLGPRPELVAEILEKSGQLFHISSTFNFLKFGNNHLKRAKVSEKVINEIKDFDDKRLSNDIFNEMRQLHLKWLRLKKEAESGSYSDQEKIDLISVINQARLLKIKNNIYNKVSGEIVNRYLSNILKNTTLQQ